MISLGESVVQLLKDSGLLLCTIESCTGGLISNWITDVSGSSEIFWGSIITYDNTLKEEIGVSPNLIQNHGAVSSEVAGKMAECGLDKLIHCLHLRKSPSLLNPKGYISISTSGIAGPTGGSELKAVGLCYIGIARNGVSTITQRLDPIPHLNRAQNKARFAEEALKLLKTCI